MRAGRLMALIFPIVMLILNASSVAVLWFGAARVDERRRCEIGALTAFLSYLMQILISVMMATFMVDDGAARLGLRRPDHRGARHRVLGACRRSPRSRTLHRHAASWCSSDVEFQYPGAAEPVLRDISFRRRRRARRPRSSAAPAPARPRCSR